jgi:predicted N-acetyltransferase YhbS
MPIALRPATAGDIEPCGRIIYEAFHQIAILHGFPPDFPDVGHAIGLAEMLVKSPAVFGVVAEQDGRIIGSNFLSEADAIRGVGPISVDPAQQGSGAGRLLMHAVIERGCGAAGIRLVQDSFNCTSLSLYSSLGFEVKEPLVIMQGRPRNAGRVPAGLEVRRMQDTDLAGCIALCERVHSFDRGNELRGTPEPWVAVRDGRVTAYATTFGFWAMAHGVAESDEGMQGLILGVAAARPEPVWFLLPTRQAGFFRWCLSEKLRVIKPMTLMAMGEYPETIRGCWFPSVFY